MTTGAQRYYVRSPDGGRIVGYEDLNVATAVALDYGEGVHLVDTNAQAYHPIAHGAQMNARDAEGTNALDLALERDKAALVEVLKRAGANEPSGDPEQIC